MSAVDASQLTLPVEILTEVFQQYFAFRNEEMKAVHDLDLKIAHGSGSSEEQQKVKQFIAPEWEALPLLLSCKHLCGIAIPELYKDISIGRRTYLRRLMRCPHPDSYHLIKTLDITHYKDEHFEELEDDVDDRIFQSIGLAYADHGRNTNWTSSLDAVCGFREGWVSNRKPQLKILKGSGVHGHVVACLLKFFNAEQVALYGFAMGRTLSPRNHRANKHLPEPFIFNSPAHLILHVDGNFDFEVPELLSLAEGHCWQVNAITITLGWRNHYDEHPLSIEVQQLGDHSYCFPTTKPWNIHGGPEVINCITFKSSCTCGRGDSTGLWQAIEEGIYQWKLDCGYW
ncbi:hypothetical protein HD553DRAFT_343529 [Filobasidium floriforme]|uniref:uncharacterized protein n=1 Tax=Filobasidium floriforme TaxID=5210 RepID=UPI001E8DB523|nr:uncharacterized protein HD553DRAFT_343529 [Filobasidium floriforme]KAH8082771.1 hypothetical protein HD553DRAFT_343529 [Filobasidium floriforme]